MLQDRQATKEKAWMSSHDKGQQKAGARCGRPKLNFNGKNNGPPIN